MCFPMHSSSIKNYYDDSTVLVTGGTGYLGKALIEKLLRTCVGIKCVYVLLRAKKGVSCNDRLKQLKNNKIFDRVRAGNPFVLDKLQGINGDINLDELGLCDADKELIQSNVNFVFHSAATIAYDLPIKVAINTNTLGTKRILDLCRNSKELKKLVYVSTAYSNPREEIVDEKVYKSSHKLDLDWYVKCAEVLPPDVAKSVLQQLHGSFPNTYTMTKFMAEQLVEEYRSQFGLPVVIVRPAAIGPSYEEPFPGWSESFAGVNGYILETIRGTLSSLVFKPSAKIDFVPLDIVCNQIIVAAWFDTLKPSKEIRVVNCTLSDINGISFLDLFKLVLKHSRENPCEQTVFYPNVYLTDNSFAHSILIAVHTLLPAYVRDIGLRLKGKVPREVKLQHFLEDSATLTLFATQRTFQFINQSATEMLQALEVCDDFVDFNIDFRSVDWDAYIKSTVLGMQKFMLNCDESSLASSKTTLQRLYAVWCLYYGSLDALTGYALYKLLSKLSLSKL